MENIISAFINKKNRFNKTNKNENKKENKILNKFNITNNNSNHHNNTGKCFLVNLKFAFNNNTPLTKAKTTIKNKIIKKSDIFPLISMNQKNIPLNTINSMSLSKNKKIKKLKKFNTNTENNKYKTINLEFNLNLTTNNSNNNMTNYKNKTNYTNNGSPSEDSYFLATKKRINEIIEKINKRYFVQLTTINYLNDIFYGNRDNQDIKYVNLSRIKIKKNKDYDNENNFKISNISRYKYNAGQIKMPKRVNHFSVRMKENGNEVYKYNKINVNERIKKFRNLKINKCKELVNNALKDLIKTRENNLNCIENMKKSCDFKYEDFINKNLI